MSSVRIVCRPLMRWPGQLRRPEQRDPGRRFRASWQATTDLLEREAAMIGTRELVIQLAVEEAELRRDGWPRAHTQPRHPGATVVVPDSDHGRLSWSTDRYQAWRHNVRAIALSMQALRAADRHGVMAGRQYAGFRELGAGDGGEAWQPSVDEAAQFLAHNSGCIGDAWEPLLKRQELVDDAYRRAAKRLHPDVGGDPQAFQRLQTAKTVLDQHGGSS